MILFINIEKLIVINLKFSFLKKIKNVLYQIFENCFKL